MLRARILGRGIPKDFGQKQNIRTSFGIILALAHHSKPHPDTFSTRPIQSACDSDLLPSSINDVDSRWAWDLRHLTASLTNKRGSPTVFQG